MSRGLGFDIRISSFALTIARLRSRLLALSLTQPRLGIGVKGTESTERNPFCMACGEDRAHKMP